MTDFTTSKDQQITTMFRVSVVITSYNQKHYLAEAIDSVLHQTHPPHEIIVADDCSTDGSIELIQDYMNEYPGTVRGVFQKSNLFIPKNRNAGLRAATGNYVMILDGDDRYLPTNLERQVEAIRNFRQPACAYTNLYMINELGEHTSIRDNELRPSGNIYIEIAKGMFGILRSMMMPYEYVRAAGFMNPDFPMYDGLVLTLQLAKHIPFIYIHEPLAEYRCYPNSASQTTTKEQERRDIHDVYREVRKVISDLPADEISEIEASWHHILNRFKTPSGCSSTCTPPDRFSDRNLIFLISQPRSGSTMLQLILKGHKDIVTASEPWIALHPLYALKSSGITTDYNSSWANESLEEFLRLNGLNKEFYKDKLHDFLISLYSKAAGNSPDKFYLDKTPRYYHIIPELAEVFPNAKFIFLLRNPLDVFASILRTWVDPGLAKLSDYKDDLITAPKSLLNGSKLLGNRSVTVRYEDIATNPSETISTVTTFLKMDYHPDMLNYSARIPAEWQFGDKCGIYRHSRPEAHADKDAASTIGSTAGRDMAAEYIRQLGPETMNGLGYDYEETLKRIGPTSANAGITAPYIWKRMLHGDNALETQLEITSSAVTRLVLNRFELLLQTSGENTRIALYGNGEHTRWLLGLLKKEMPHVNIRFIIDDLNTSVSNYNIPVYKPENISLSDIDVIVPSSDVWENEICNRCHMLFGETIRVWRLYENMQPGPYPKLDQLKV